MSRNRPITIMDLIGIGGFVATSEGRRLAARFCQSVKRGEVPCDQDLKALAYSLQAIVDAKKEDSTAHVMAEVARRMGVATKQGKGLSSEKIASSHIYSVISYIRRLRNLRNQGISEKESQRRAREEMCAAEGIGDRAARNRIKKHQATAKRILSKTTGSEIKI